MIGPGAAELLIEARQRAGLTQRELARRAGTVQSVVARIESGATSPRWNTLVRLLQSAGLDLLARLEPAPVVHSHMLDDVSRILALTPEQRLQELANASRLLSTAHRV
jgi:transcriptional regulator with XRE-family HTH domain